MMVLGKVKPAPGPVQIPSLRKENKGGGVSAGPPASQWGQSPAVGGASSASPAPAPRTAWADSAPPYSSEPQFFRPEQPRDVEPGWSGGKWAGARADDTRGGGQGRGGGEEG